MQLLEIGRLPAINNYNDPDNLTRKAKEKQMRIADLIPVYFSMNILNIFTTQTQTAKPIRLNFDVGIEEYNRKLSHVGLRTDLVGLRIWISSDSNSQEQLANSYKPNKYTETYDQMFQNFEKFSDFMKSIGNKLNLNSGPAISMISGAIFEGRQISLPKIWSRSEYSTTFSLNFRLISPYGSIKAFRKWIGEPLIYYLALISPSSYDGVTYGLPPFIYLRVYGDVYMPLAIPQAISITKNYGESRVNKYKQPLDITVNTTFESAFPGFGAMLNDSGESKVDVLESPINGVSTATTYVPGVVTLSNFIESMRPYQTSSFDESGNYSASINTVINDTIEEIVDGIREGESISYSTESLWT